MNRKLSKLIKENYLTNDEKINNCFISLLNKNPFKFLYEHDYIFCSNYHFRIHNWEEIKWCPFFKHINIDSCNYSCKEYKIRSNDYNCIPSFYSVMNHVNHKSILNLGILL